MKLAFELNKARKLSDDDVEEIIKGYKRGESISALARAFGVTRWTIHHHRMRVLEPKKFKEMEQRKIERNKLYKHKKAPVDYLSRLRLSNGTDKVTKYRSEIEQRTRNKQKRLQWQRIYRDKNKEHINKIARKNYHKRKAWNQKH